MSHVKIISRAAAGLYRPRKGEMSGKWPSFLLNNADKHAHILTGNAVFPCDTLIRMDMWTQLLQMQRPNPPKNVEGRVIFIETNSFWPIDNRPFSDTAQKAEDCRTFTQETLLASRAESSAESGPPASDRWVFGGAAAIAGLGLLLILGQFAVDKLGDVGTKFLPLFGGG